eukprot:1238075-Karenia_brevis.AAC.1
MGRIVFCCICGSYASSKSVNLKHGCDGPPLSQSSRDKDRRRRRERLLKGLHPVTGRPIQQD